MNVFVHVRTDAKSETEEWENYGVEFEQLPRVGDYISLDLPEYDLLVRVVVHCPHSDQYQAELWCEHRNYRPDVWAIPKPEQYDPDPFSEN